MNNSNLLARMCRSSWQPEPKRTASSPCCARCALAAHAAQLHYEGGGSRTAATDIVCPMYARVHQILRLADEPGVCSDAA